MRSSIPVLAISLLLLAAPSCVKTQPSQTDGTNTSGPKKGAAVTVYIRPAVLGAANTVPIFTDSANGAQVSVSGTFERADGEWILLTRKPANQPEQRLWIPRDVILSIAETVR